MLVPLKHENLERNTLVLGADILNLLKKRTFDVESMFQEVKTLKSVGLEQYYNTVTFLWLSDLVEIQNYRLILK